MPKLDQYRVKAGLARIDQGEVRAPILSPEWKARLTTILQQPSVSAGELRDASKILDKALGDADVLLKDVTQMKGWNQANSWVFDYQLAFQSLKNVVNDGKKETIGGKLKSAADGLADVAGGALASVVMAYGLAKHPPRF